MRIAIIGGGIGGLTLALALRARGIEAEIYEQAARLTEIGAAVALSANATRELARLGLLERAEAVSTEPTELIHRDGRTGARIASQPVRAGGRYRHDCGAPYLGIHRADLQRILGEAFDGSDLHLGHRLAAIEEGGPDVTLRFANGETARADLVVGADGVRSVVRRLLTGQDGTIYSGTSAYRGLVPAGDLPNLPDPEAIQFWAGPGAHLLHYAIGGDAGVVNFFAVVEGPAGWPGGTSWTIPCAPGDFLDAFRGWHPAVTEMIAASPLHQRWGLFVTQPLRSWHRGRAVLLGDAAHAMLPHHGQGANTTIEDAVTLAGLLADAAPSALPDTLVRYEGLRRPRTRLIQRSAWDANRALHRTDGEDLDARDRAFRAFPERFGWIHAFDASKALRP